MPRSRLLLLCFVLFATGCGRDSADPAQAKGSPESRKKQIQQREGKMSAEAQSRRDRSVAILKSEKVPVNEHLPVTETEAESKRRTTEEVALRAIDLCVVSLKGEGMEQKMVDTIIEKYELTSAFTPKELKFINNQTPLQQERIQFAWRYEDYWVMLWALGFVDKLDRPDAICNVQKAVLILKERDRKKFLSEAKLRPQSEILDAADLIYRYHRAITDARINNREMPPKLDNGVVMERHYALNWLIGYSDQEWDDISTDT